MLCFDFGSSAHLGSPSFKGRGVLPASDGRCRLGLQSPFIYWTIAPTTQRLIFQRLRKISPVLHNPLSHCTEMIERVGVEDRFGHAFCVETLSFAALGHVETVLCRMVLVVMPTVLRPVVGNGFCENREGGDPRAPFCADCVVIVCRATKAPFCSASQGRNRRFQGPRSSVKYNPRVGPDLAYTPTHCRQRMGSTTDGYFQLQLQPSGIRLDQTAFLAPKPVGFA